MRRYIFPILFFMILALIPGITERAGAVMYSNVTLPNLTPGFALKTVNPGPPGVFLVGFNPREVSPGPPEEPTLDLTDAGSPVLNNPSTSSDFSIFWGMYPPDPGAAVGSINPDPPNIKFSLPMDATGAFRPPNPNNDGSYDYSFGATDGVNIFDIFFTIKGATLMDTESWEAVGSTNPGPPGIQFNFSFLTAGDPTLSFSVKENGQSLNFAPVPEPSTLLLLGSGMAGIAMIRIRKFRKNRKMVA